MLLSLTFLVNPRVSKVLGLPLLHLTHVISSQGYKYGLGNTWGVTVINLFSYRGMLQMRLLLMKGSRSISWRDLLDHFNISWLLKPFHLSRGF
jgi:hypothetical protein